LYGWFAPCPKQLPIQPQTPLFVAVLGWLVVVFVWLGVACAAANPTNARVNAAIMTVAVMIFVFGILFYHHILIYA
jgi:hypothetical protein